MEFDCKTYTTNMDMILTTISFLNVYVIICLHKNINAHERRKRFQPSTFFDKIKIHPSKKEKYVLIPKNTISVFKSVVEDRTERKIKTGGVLMGKLLDGEIEITHIVIPRQDSSSNNFKCTRSGWKEVLDYRDRKNFLLLGGIQTEFISDGNRAVFADATCHDQFYYQKDFSDAISIVVNPTVGYRISRLSKIGMEIVENCRVRARKHHNHERKNEISVDAKYKFTNKTVRLLDLRTKSSDTRKRATNEKDEMKTNFSAKPNEKSITDPNVYVPGDLVDTFLNISIKNCRALGRTVETMGNFLGNLKHGRITITHLVILKQEGSWEDCKELPAGRYELEDYCEKNGLIHVGGVHTHPTGNLILSDGDCRFLVNYAKRFNLFVEAICYPGIGFNMFRLTETGLRVAILDQRSEGINFYLRGDVFVKVPYKITRSSVKLVDFR